MDKNLDELKDRANAAREGMGIESEQQSKTVEEVADDSENTDPQEDEQTEEGDTESESDESGEDANDEESGDTEETDEHQPHQSVYRELNEIRSQRRKAEAENRKILDLLGAESVDDAVTRLTALREASSEQAFKDAATEMGVSDPENLKKLSDFIASQVRSSLGADVSSMRERLSRYEESAESIQAERDWQESLGAMNDEWKEVRPLVEQEYKATPAQLDQAHELMTELAHSEKYHDKELDYILYKERDQFEQIFGTPKRRSMLPSRGAPIVRTEEEGVLPKIVAGDHASILKAREKMRRIASGAEVLQDAESDRI